MSTRNEFFNPSDFESVQLKIHFQNTTSGSGALPPELVSLQEMTEDGLVLGVPNSSCNINHSVVIEIERRDPTDEGEPLRFHATGKIREVEKTDDKAVIRAAITMLQYDERTWKYFLSLNEESQQAVTRLFEQMRG